MGSSREEHPQPHPRSFPVINESTVSYHDILEQGEAVESVISTPAEPLSLSRRNGTYERAIRQEDSENISEIRLSAHSPIQLGFTRLSMPVCGICSSVIRKLHQSRQHLREGQEVDVVVSFFRHPDVHDCWIYFKFLLWLKSENHTLFQQWHRQQIPVTFSTVDSIHSREPRPDVLLPLFVDIAVQGHDKNDTSCRIDLNFIPAKGISYSACTIIH